MVIAVHEDRSFVLRGGRTGVILLHGLGGKPAELQGMARGLANAGYTVSCPQLAGHSGSREEMRAALWQDWYGTLVDAHEKLKADCDTILVGGLSMGALLALHHAVQEPKQVHGVIALAPLLKLDGWAVPSHAHLFRLVTTRWCARLFNFPELPNYGVKDDRVREVVKEIVARGGPAEAARMSKPGEAMLELQRLSRVVRRELGAVRQPTLIIHPREDDRASFRANAVYLQERLGGLVDTLVLDDSYHVITVDRQRDLVMNKTVQFTGWLEEHIGVARARDAVAKAAGARA
jgi:carboxylesterase